MNYNTVYVNQLQPTYYRVDFVQFQPAISNVNPSRPNSRPLEEELRRVLRPYFRSNEDTEKVVVAFKQVSYAY